MRRIKSAKVAVLASPNFQQNFAREGKLVCSWLSHVSRPWLDYPEHSRAIYVKSVMRIILAKLYAIRRLELAFLVLAVYIGVYVLLSLCGQYQGNVTSLSKLGLWIRGIPDREEWKPKFLIITRFPGQNPPSFIHANNLGYCFLPLVFVDQQIWHVTQPTRFGSPARHLRFNDWASK